MNMRVFMQGALPRMRETTEEKTSEGLLSDEHKRMATLNKRTLSILSF